MVNQQIGSYTIVAPLGVGGMTPRCVRRVLSACLGSLGALALDE
ncbi:MAG TPA: hypothetical protein VN797_01440 [Gemmatimonadaceae bacterium]|nr:hypothetical protein [Gemmatimonadaceae bacterium]